MNEENLMIDIKKDSIKDLYILSSPFGYIEIPAIRMVQLPTSLLRKFETQKKISFRVLVTALNFWMTKGDEVAIKLRALELKLRKNANKKS